MKKVFLSLLSVVVLSLSVYAQERQVEVYVDRSKGQATSLGGRFWTDLGPVRMVADVDFSQAVNLFLNPVDQVEVQGQAWLFLTAFDGSKKSQTRPFVFGGVSTTQFVGQTFVGTPANPIAVKGDAVQTPMGIGLQHFRSSGFELTPTLEFTTKGLTERNPVLGNEYRANVYVKVPVSKEFRLSLNPYVSPQVINGFSTTIYGARLGFIRTF